MDKTNINLDNILSEEDAEWVFSTLLNDTVNIPDWTSQFDFKLKVLDKLFPNRID